VIRQTAIVTGATKGLGRATALEFAQAGYRVIGIYLADDAAAVEMTAKLTSLSADSFLVKHDISTENAALWSSPEIQTAGKLVLVNNASAPFVPQPLHISCWEDFESAWNVGIKGSWLCSRGLLRRMIKCGGGTIVNVLTTAVHGIPPKGFSAYITTKHALRGFTLALSAEYASRGIRVFSVSPGFMSTQLTSGWDVGLIDAIRAQSPTSDPPVAARNIRALVEASAGPGKGEDYLI
jgi:NAD(P)-dependent dehydrogenase (short-subunit alcohol dehydrogenase family)